MRYVKGQARLGILFSSRISKKLTVFYDADWASCPNTRKSVSDFLVKLGHSLISWKSKKQGVVSRRSTEVGYRSMSNSAAEVVWIIELLKELKVDIDIPVTIYCDNRSTMQISANPVFHERTKHIELDCHFIWEKIQQGNVETKYISTKE